MDNVPISERVFKGRFATFSDLMSKSSHDLVTLRSKSYKQWNDDIILKAITAVVEGSSVRKAALDYGIPKSTLNDRIQGKVIHGSHSGRSKYLSDEEELELVRFLLRSASIGYPRSRYEVIAIVQRVCLKNGFNVTVTHGWWEAFCRRHPTVTLRKPAHLSAARAKASDPEMLSCYFDLLEETLTEHKLLDKPSQIFNMDETGVPLNPDFPKGIF